VFLRGGKDERKSLFVSFSIQHNSPLNLVLSNTMKSQGHE
jgi:hypothetical protein